MGGGGGSLQFRMSELSVEEWKGATERDLVMLCRCLHHIKGVLENVWNHNV